MSERGNRGAAGVVEESPLLSRASEEPPVVTGSRTVAADRGGGPDGQSTSSSSLAKKPPNAAGNMTASIEGNPHQDQQHGSGLYPQPRDVRFGMHSPPSNFPEQQFGTNTNSVEMHDNETFDGSEDTPANIGGPSVTCRVCEAEIPLEGKTNQHVVRCQKCNEVTPIRAAPPGKKYVRCPCNCLLVCKATSTRIACPRQNCRRVITLASGPPNSGIPGTAIRAPVGTCRVQCAYCQEIFMFNTLTNQLAICPHCRKSSSVGARYARTRSMFYLLGLLLTSIFLIGVLVAISRGQDSFFMWAFVLCLVGLCLLLTYRFVFYWRIRISQILGPL